MPAVVRGWRARGVAALALLALAGCRTPYAGDPDTIPHSAYRPSYDAGGPRRTLFLGGYAGYNYGPVGTQTELATPHGGDVWGYPAARPAFSGLFRR